MTDPSQSSAQSSLDAVLGALTGQQPSVPAPPDLLPGYTPPPVLPPTAPVQPSALVQPTVPAQQPAAPQYPAQPATGQIPAYTGQVPAFTGQAPTFAPQVPTATGQVPVVPQQGRHAALPQAQAGWGPAAIAINSFRQIDNPLVLFLQPQGHSPIVIELGAHEFSWDTPLTGFPRDPGVVQVATQPITDGSPSPLRRPGQDLDSLLWLIGLSAFPDRLAPWLNAGEKVRLRRWPYFESLFHTPEQAKVIKVLARGFMTIDKAAAASKANIVEVARVVNALSLMAALRRQGGDTLVGQPGGPVDLSQLPPPGR